MRLTAFLADAAQADPTGAGKVNALGLGWVVIGTPLPAVALVIFVDIDRDEPVQDKYTLDITLTDEAGQVIELPGSNGPQTIKFQANVRVIKRTDLATRIVRTVVAAVISPGIPLKPGDYEWAIDSADTGSSTTAPFTVVASQQQVHPPLGS
jgi:hypothetical protein